MIQEDARLLTKPEDPMQTRQQSQPLVSFVRMLTLIGVGVLLAPRGQSAAADWPMLGRDATRNAVSSEADTPTDWDVETGRHIKWAARLGSACIAEPVVSGGLVWIGTNNSRLNETERRKDAAVLMCFRESDGKRLYEYVSPRLETGRDDDWPLSPIGCSPLIEEDRMWFTTNRCETICMDVGPLRRGERSPSIVWKVDMRTELGVDPLDSIMFFNRSCSIAGYKDWIYVITTNGTDASTKNISAPEAPSVVCLDKLTGRVVWTDNSPGANILRTQTASPLVMEIAGKAQVIVPQGDGWVRSFAPEGDGRGGSKLIWKFDMNFKTSKYSYGGTRDGRNTLFATPVYHKDRIYIANGKEPEEGGGPGRLACIDPTKWGDISSELALDKAGRPIPHRRLQAVDPEKGERAVANPNSGLVWEFTSLGRECQGGDARLGRPGRDRR
jgi:outer membrane protein assembly factor BamB